jgi:MFS family permease
VAGWLAQRDGVRYVLPAGLALCALATIVTGLVTGFALLLVLRVLLGTSASPTHAMRSTGTISLQRSQEFDNRLLICRAKVFKTFCYVAGFAAVAQDSVAKCQRGAVVHQHWLEANSP